MPGRRAGPGAGAVVAALLAAGVFAAGLAAEEAGDEFAQTAIPADYASVFACHQNGAEILRLEAVATFAPARVQGVMTFSLNTRDGATHLVYLDGATACRLEVRPAE